jgi:hypothetical protein
VDRFDRWCDDLELRVVAWYDSRPTWLRYALIPVFLVLVVLTANGPGS